MSAFQYMQTRSPQSIYKTFLKIQKAMMPTSHIMQAWRPVSA